MSKMTISNVVVSIPCLYSEVLLLYIGVRCRGNEEMSRTDQELRICTTSSAPLPQAIGPTLHGGRLLGVGAVAVIDFRYSSLGMIEELADHQSINPEAA